MNHSKTWVEFLATGCVLCLIVLSAVQAEGPELDRGLAELATFDWGQNLDSLRPIELAIQRAQEREDTAALSQLEARLLTVLDGPAPRAAKDYVCRQLVRIGSAQSVPTLARLLEDPELAHMARAALEVIDDPSALEVMRLALDRVDGRQRVGLVQSVGTLRDTESVPALAALLESPDAELAAAAAAALGRIGSSEAAQCLEQIVDRAPANMRATLNDARLNAADALVRHGQPDQAADIYQKLVTNETAHVRVAALRGLAAARPAEAESRLMQALTADDPTQRAAAADWIRDRHMANQVEIFAGRLTELPPGGQIALLPALAASGEARSAVRMAAIKALENSDANVRHQAMDALRIVGTADDVLGLANIAAGRATADERASALVALCRLTAAGTDETIRSLADTTSLENLRSTLIRSLAERRSFESVPQILKWAETSQGPARIAALEALQHLTDPTAIPHLITLVPQTTPGPEREAADRALWLACLRIADPEQRTDPLLKAVDTADVTTRAALLPTLGRLGGEPSRQVIHKMLDSSDPSLQDAAVRALANWPDASGAGKLLEIARSDGDLAHRVWAVRAFARVVAIKGQRPDAETVKLLAEALAVAERVEDKQLILSRLATVRVPGALETVLTQLDQPQLKESVVEAVVALADGMRRSHPQAAQAGLKRVRDETNAPELRGRIDQLLWYFSQQTQ